MKKQLSIVLAVVMVVAVALGYVIHDDKTPDFFVESNNGKTSIQPLQQQTVMTNAEAISKHFTVQGTPEKKVVPEGSPELRDANPVAEEVARYEIQMMNESRDNQWAQAVEATVEEVFHTSALSGLSPVSAECRNTLCRWELASNDEVDADNAERAIVGTLMQKDGGATVVRRIQDPAGNGLRFVVLYAKPGHVLPSTE